MEKMLLELLVALTFTELVHNCFEIWGIRQKVHWLQARIDNKTHGKWPLNINTALKAYSLHAAIFFFTTFIGFVTLLFIDMGTSGLLYTGIVLLVLNYSFTTLVVHEYHEEIGKILARFKR